MINLSGGSIKKQEKSTDCILLAYIFGIPLKWLLSYFFVHSFLIIFTYYTEDAMSRYNKSNIKELKDYFCHSCVHDAKLKNIKYDYGEDTVKIELFNPIFDIKINLTFLNIGIMFAIKGDWSENRETIISLTAEEDFSYLQNYNIKHSEYMEDSLYLLFQMFSGDELHIVSKEVIIEVNNKY